MAKSRDRSGAKAESGEAAAASEPVNKAVEQEKPDPGIKKLRQLAEDTAERWKVEQKETLEHNARQDEATRKMLENARAARADNAKQEEK